MSATIVSFAQFQESRQRRQSSMRLPNVPAAAAPDTRAPDDQPLTMTHDAPAPAPLDPAPRP